MMARVVAEVAPSDRPFGVDYLWDPQAALAVAAVTGASFIREVATGVYESDMGVWAPDAGKLLRYRRELDAEHVAVFMNITPEFASTLGTRDIATTARSVRVSSLADAILVSGPMAGAEPSVDAVREAKRGCGDETPVFANTGVKSTNVKNFLAVADGAIVGSDLKVDGGTWNPVDPERANRFMTQVRAGRESLQGACSSRRRCSSPRPCWWSSCPSWPCSCGAPRRTAKRTRPSGDASGSAARSDSAPSSRRLAPAGP